jgi:hypothetical protein
VVLFTSARETGESNPGGTETAFTNGERKEP